MEEKAGFICFVGRLTWVPVKQIDRRREDQQKDEGVRYDQRQQEGGNSRDSRGHSKAAPASKTLSRRLNALGHHQLRK